MEFGEGGAWQILISKRREEWGVQRVGQMEGGKGGGRGGPPVPRAVAAAGLVAAAMGGY
jgi:hypothetical protein